MNSKRNTGDKIKSEPFSVKITTQSLHRLALQLINFVAAILYDSNSTHLIYSTLHCRYSKDISRQSRDNCDRRRHSQKGHSRGLVVRKLNITMHYYHCKLFINIRPHRKLTWKKLIKPSVCKAHSLSFFS